MISHLVNVVRAHLHERRKDHERSPRWPHVRDAFLEFNGACAACGGKKRLQVHHVKPFHLHRDLELDMKNLLVLCMGRHDCHLMAGHGGKFDCWNPTVEADARMLREFPERRSEIEARIRAGRRD